jgi:hypothetical protein
MKARSAEIAWRSVLAAGSAVSDDFESPEFPASALSGQFFMEDFGFVKG